MGCFDTINVKCPHCRRRTYSQTKVLGRCLMDHFREGDEIDNDAYANCIFSLKENCEHCNKKVNIIIKDKKIIRATKDEAEHTEGYWGEVR